MSDTLSGSYYKNSGIWGSILLSPIQGTNIWFKETSIWDDKMKRPW